MTKKLKSLTLLCITTLLLGLSACGATDDATTGSAVTGNTNQTNATSAPTEAPTEAPTAEPTEAPTPEPTSEPVVKQLKETTNNDNGDIIENKLCTSSGTLSKQDTSTYNEDRLLVRIDSVYPDSSSYKIYSYATDASGKVIEEFNADGILCQRE